MDNNFESTFWYFLRSLQIKITKTSALEKLKSHPDEGSVLAYSDTLSFFKIDNIVVRIEKERLDELPVPFVAYLSTNGGTFALVDQILNNQIKWFDTNEGWRLTAKEEFFNVWQGIVVLAEPGEEAGEENFNKKRSLEILRISRFPLAMVLLSMVLSVFFIGYNFQTNFNLVFIPILLKLIGIGASILLIGKSLGVENRIIDRLCQHGSKVNCQSILDSPKAQITSWFSLSDLGFIYFWGSFFGLLFCLEVGLLSSYFTFQWVFSLIAVFFSIYSIWYQAVKVKIWCTLCLIVVTVFILEFFYLIGFIDFTPIFQLKGIWITVLGFFIPIIFLLLFKTDAVNAKKSILLQRKLNKIYANPEYLNTLLANQKDLHSFLPDMPILEWGNKGAKNIITIISNPLCAPCAAVHQYFDSYLEKNKNVKCRVVFLSKNDGPGALFVRKLFSLPVDVQPEALSKWYSQNDRNFEKWNSGYKEYIEDKHSLDWQRAHNQWVNAAEVRATPTLFINGKKKPDDLSIKDLSRILDLVY